MRVLTVPLPAPGHLAAMVPLCWGLRAGHDVLVASPPDLVPAVKAAGLTIAEIGTEARLADAIGDDTSPDMFPGEAFGQRDTDLGKFLWQMVALDTQQYADRYVEDYLALGRSYRPDLLLIDPMAVVGRVVGAVLRVPTVAYRWGVEPLSGPFEDNAHQLHAPLCDRLGLPHLPDPTLVVDPCPPSLQVEDAPAGHRVRYVAHNGTGIQPDWALTRPSGRRVAVCMGGTVLALTGPGPLLRVIEALSALADVDVVAALSAEHRQLVGELPAGVRVVEAVPLSLFLGTCDLLIHHGGSGTGLTGTSFGLPQLVLPQFFDEFDYGRRLAEAGAGISIPDAAGQSDVDGIRAAITKLLDDPGYTEAAQALRAEVEAAPAPDTLVGLLQDLARSHRPE